MRKWWPPYHHKTQEKGFPMSSVTTSATSTSLSTFLQSALTIAKDDTLKAALPILNTFFANIAANSSPNNLLAQLAALQVNLLAALPSIEQQVIKDLAALIQQEVNELTAAAA